VGRDGGAYSGSLGGRPDPPSEKWRRKASAPSRMITKASKTRMGRAKTGLPVRKSEVAKKRAAKPKREARMGTNLSKKGVGAAGSAVGSAGSRGKKKA